MNPGETLASDLRALLDAGDDTVCVDQPTLAAHAGDKWFASHLPAVVVFARQTEDVSRLLKFCSANGIAVTARGAGYGYVGGCVPFRSCG